jgi:hypothetical protein
LFPCRFWTFRQFHPEMCLSKRFLGVWDLCHRPSWVPGSNRAKTYGSKLSPIFQTLTSGVMGNFPKNNVWLTRGNVIQILDVLVATSANFPEKACYRESFSLIGLNLAKPKNSAR